MAIYIIVYTAFIFACIGLTQILVYGKILDPIRPKHHFFHCPLCVGFWSGLIIATPFLFFDLFGIFGIYSMFEKIVALIMAGCMSSCISYAFSSIFGDNGININLK